ncbi:hypothetical protein RRG08_057165 [Elysia crispata]|uniref:G-protein coupled receptors family 1 profile domain-containing protein n=1 Tax=Elysia crispata TaxID=231223 RepID=A0AAE1E0L3_9GAST|nr:hypothetical protein RRG08_057165 [Elysia crispata]
MDEVTLAELPILMVNVQVVSNSVEEACVTSVKELHNTTTLAAVLSFMSIIILFGSLGNILVILAVSQTKKLQTASNLFVANLSLCDLLFVSLVLPVNMYTYLEGGWRFNITICRAVGFLGYALTGTTIITITAIAWNRYKLVVDSKMYHVIFRRKRMGLMLAGTWLIPAAFLQPAVFGIWGHFGFIPMLSSCNLDLDKSSQTFKIFLLIVRAAIPCGLIIYFYTSIYITTRASRLRLQHRKMKSNSHSENENNSCSNSNNDNNNGDNEDTAKTDSSVDILNTNSSGDSTTEVSQAVPGPPNKNLKREMRLTRMMIAIFLVFVLSYFPCTISSAIDMSHTLSKTFHMFCQTSIFLGSAINPLLYGFMNGQFRTAYYNIIMCSMLKRPNCHGSTIAFSSSLKKKKQEKASGIGRAVKTRPVDSIASYTILPSNYKKVSPAMLTISTKNCSPKSNRVNLRTANLPSASVATPKSQRV